MKQVCTLLFVLLMLSACAVQKQSTDNDVVWSVEHLPQYPGGDQALLDWIYKELKYPKKAVQRKIEGEVYVTYIIGIGGSIESAHVSRGVHKLLDKEALRVVNAIKGYTPGITRGKPVRMKYTIPIKFKL